jgi:hypothetical protein
MRHSVETTQANGKPNSGLIQRWQWLMTRLIAPLFATLLRNPWAITQQRLREIPVNA